MTSPCACAARIDVLERDLHKVHTVLAEALGKLGVTQADIDHAPVRSPERAGLRVIKGGRAS